MKLSCLGCPFKSYHKNVVQIHQESLHDNLEVGITSITCKKCRKNDAHKICRIEQIERKIENTVSQFSCFYCKSQSYYRRNLFRHVKNSHQGMEVIFIWLYYFVYSYTCIQLFSCVQLLCFCSEILYLAVTSVKFELL